MPISCQCLLPKTNPRSDPTSFFQFGWGPACWIYASEIPAARLRSLNVSYAAATQWLFNFVVARAVPTMLVTVGSDGYG